MMDRKFQKEEQQTNLPLKNEIVNHDKNKDRLSKTVKHSN